MARGRRVAAVPHAMKMWRRAKLARAPASSPVAHHHQLSTNPLTLDEWLPRGDTADRGVLTGEATGEATDATATSAVASATTAG